MVYNSKHTKKKSMCMQRETKDLYNTTLYIITKGGKIMVNNVEIKTMSVKEASQLMGKSEQFIRIGLRNNRLPFGVAVKLSSQWTYYISPKLFYEYVGCNPEKETA